MNQAEQFLQRRLSASKIVPFETALRESGVKVSIGVTKMEAEFEDGSRVRLLAGFNPTAHGR